MNNHFNSFQFAAILSEPSPVSALCWQMQHRLTVLVPLLRVWVHCPRASNGLLPPRSYLVGYVRWHARSDSVSPLLQTIIPTAFSSQTGYSSLTACGASLDSGTEKIV